MTRKEVINKLIELGINDTECKYYEIKDFLYANNCPIKYITDIKLSDNDEGNRAYEEEHWLVYIQLGEDYGWLEV